MVFEWSDQKRQKRQHLSGRRRLSIAMLVLVTTLIAVGCVLPAPLPTSPSGNTTLPAESTEPEPIIIPTLPEIIPGYLEIDPATGLHMTGKPTVVDFTTYRLKVFGLVGQELSLAYDEIRRLPKLTDSPQLVCRGFFVDNAVWSGASLAAILEMAQIRPDAASITLRGADGYATNISLTEARQPGNFLAYKLESDVLPVLQGFPLRAVFPELDGYSWVKWLVEIEVK